MMRMKNLWNVSVACVIVWLCLFNRLRFGMLSTRREPVECFGSLGSRLDLFFNRLLFSGCCLIVGSLWNVSVCLLSVCVGCLGDCCR